MATTTIQFILCFTAVLDHFSVPQNSSNTVTIIICTQFTTFSHRHLGPFTFKTRIKTNSKCPVAHFVGEQQQKKKWWRKAKKKKEYLWDANEYMSIKQLFYKRPRFLHFLFGIILYYEYNERIIHIETLSCFKMPSTYQ